MRNGIFVALLGMLAAGAHAAAPPAPKSVVRDVYAYLLEPRRDIGQDPPAQSRWLTGSLRELLRAADGAAKSALKCPDAGPDQRPPDNGIFLDAWDPPISCDVNYTSTEAFFSRIGVLCKWGPGTNYPGEERRMVVMLELGRLADRRYPLASKQVLEGEHARPLAQIPQVRSGISQRQLPQEQVGAGSIGFLAAQLPQRCLLRGLAVLPLATPSASLERFLTPPGSLAQSVN